MCFSIVTDAKSSALHLCTSTAHLIFSTVMIFLDVQQESRLGNATLVVENVQVFPVLPKWRIGTLSLNLLVPMAIEEISLKKTEILNIISSISTTTNSSIYYLYYMYNILYIFHRVLKLRLWTGGAKSLLSFSVRQVCGNYEKKERNQPLTEVWDIAIAPGSAPAPPIIRANPPRDGLHKPNNLSNVRPKAEIEPGLSQTWNLGQAKQWKLRTETRN